ncbi:hypothetical protein B0H19DRAFT_1250462 [Mycena capillaripes]|nr:hypothetical protein B0H19DRAFT_1250462 [Mycena capillaripes]
MHVASPLPRIGTNTDADEEDDEEGRISVLIYASRAGVQSAFGVGVRCAFVELEVAPSVFCLRSSSYLPPACPSLATHRRRSAPASSRGAGSSLTLTRRENDALPYCNGGARPQVAGADASAGGCAAGNIATANSMRSAAAPPVFLRSIPYFRCAFGLLYSGERPRRARQLHPPRALASASDAGRVCISRRSIHPRTSPRLCMFRRYPVPCSIQLVTRDALIGIALPTAHTADAGRVRASRRLVCALLPMCRACWDVGLRVNPTSMSAQRPSSAFFPLSPRLSRRYPEPCPSSSLLPLIGSIALLLLHSTTVHTAADTRHPPLLADSQSASACTPAGPWNEIPDA